MALDPTLSTAAISAVAAVAASLITILVAKITSGPATNEALTKRFMALLEAQDKKIAKLEANLADLEIMIIRKDAWEDEASILALNRGVTLPPRPKFAHFSNGAGG